MLNRKSICHGILTVASALMVGLVQPGNAQTLNPPYPRLGIFTFSGTYSTCLDILKNFDVIAFPTNNEMARQYKAQNPNVILLACAASFIGYGMDEPFPEGWYYHDVDGKRFEVFGDAYLMNMSQYCPKLDLGDGAGPVSFGEHALLYSRKTIDFTYYDGVFHDWWWNSPGYDARMRGDLNGNRIADSAEWGVDSVNAIWLRDVIRYQNAEYAIPGLEYLVVQIGSPEIWPYVNGACYEDWPLYNGPFNYWLDRYNDTKTTTRQPRIMFLNGAHRHFYNAFPVEPYKNNYRAVRFALSSSLLTSSFFYVDEGNGLGHHGNVHFYDEFEAKGKLGYPRTDMIRLTNKVNATTPLASGVWVRFFDNGVSLVNASGSPQSITASDLALLDPMSGGKYYRFWGGQDPDFNNGQELTNSNSLILWGDNRIVNWEDPEVFGDGAMLFREKKTLVTPIVVDNNTHNQTSPGSDPIQYSGSWVLSSEGRKCYAVYDDRNYGVFQPSSFAWSPPGSGENTATYTPTIGIPGVYEVFEWHGYRGSNPGDYPQATNVKAKVIFNGVVDSVVTINQAQNIGQWNSLGIYYFPKGKTSKVVLSNEATGIVLSDAVQFVYRRPTWESDTQAPNPPQNVKVIRKN